MRIIDIEYSWNVNHEDLSAARAPGAVVSNGTPNDPFTSIDHGTAVLGEMVADDNSVGVTGLANQAAVGMTNANNTEDGYDLADSINIAAAALTDGDVILLEQQTQGANGGCNEDSQMGCVPVEYAQAWYDAIVAATSDGIIVVEAAGNGSQDLDSSAYSATFGTRTDSGAIIVGAGAAPGCTSPTRGRLGFSSFGSPVDVHAWGECVYTTGYGWVQDLTGDDRDYTHNFGGTSSASPIVASAAAILSSVAQAQGDANGLTSTETRTILQNTGTAQETGSGARAGNIGPLPNLAAALAAYVPTAAVGGVLTTVEGTDTTLDAGGSSDPQGGALSYGWDLDNDGQYDDGNAATATFTRVGQDGSFPVGLRVTDADGASDTATAMVTVTNAAPTVVPSIAGGAEGSLLSLTGTAGDAGWLDDLAVTVDWGDGAQPIVGSVEHDRSDASSAFGGSHRFGDNGTYQVAVCAADDDTQTCVTTPVTVTNAATTVGVASGQVTTLNEGDVLSFAAGFSDPGWLDTYTSQISWGTGDSETGTLAITSPGPLADVGTLTGTHRYGDNGAFAVTGSVNDDDGGSDSDQIQLSVNNVAPTATIDTSDGTLINGASTILGQAGQPVSLSGRSTDPGSDDLTLGWDFADGSTASTVSLANSPLTDPLPSPSVQPRDVGDTQSHAFAGACTYDIGLSATDDDGGVDVYSATVLITGSTERNRGAGYWQQQFHPSGSAYFTQDALACLLAVSGFVSQTFDEVRTAATVPEGRAVLAPAPWWSARDQLDRQTLAALLNFANGAVAYDEMVDTDGNRVVDTTFGDMIVNAETVRVSPAATPLQVQAQIKILDRFNRRDE